MTKVVAYIVIAIIVLLGAWYFFNGVPAPSPSQPANQAAASDSGTQAASQTPSASDAALSGGATVTYTDSGFSPSTVTIKKGETVTWVDEKGSPMWVASNEHPSHTGYDGTSRSQHCTAGYTGAAPFDECAGGTSYTFTFDTAGTWGYHDHLNAGTGGTVIVTQ